jgi:hypothetical protein
MQSLRRFWRPETGFFLAIWLFLLLVGQTRLLRDPGTFWHTVAGEKMLTEKQLIRGDPFGFTAQDADHPWIPHQWFGECLMALLHRIDGLDTLLLAAATILAGLYAWLARRLVRAGLHWVVAAVIVVGVLSASSSHFHARPHLATIVFLGTTFAFLIDFEAGRVSLPHCAWLVPVYLFWTSVHGGMLGGLVTMGAAVAGWVVWRGIGWESPLTSVKQFLGWCLLIVVCGATAFVNPYGVALPRTWLAIMGQPLHEIIVEHARLNPTRLEGAAVLFLGAVYVAILLSLTRRPRVTWLLPLIWFGLTCTGIRHAPLFGITAGLALAEVLPHTRFAVWQVRTGGDLFIAPKEPDRAGWWPLLLPVLAVATALGLQMARVEVPLLGHGWARLDPTHWPEELRPELDELRRTQPEGTPIFNDLAFGGYLIYFAPNLRVFIDDRCELYGYPRLREYVDADEKATPAILPVLGTSAVGLSGSPLGPGPLLTTAALFPERGTAEAMREWQQRYGPFSLALVRTDSGFDRYFRASADWEPVKPEHTEPATLYRRKSSHLPVSP